MAETLGFELRQDKKLKKTKENKAEVTEKEVKRL